MNIDTSTKAIVNPIANTRKFIEAAQSATFATVRLIRALWWMPEMRRARHKKRYERMMRRGAAKVTG